MNKKLTIIAIIYIVLVLVCGLIIISQYKKSEKASAENQNINAEINEVKNLISKGDTEQAINKCNEMMQSGHNDAESGETALFVKCALAVIAVSIIGIITMTVYLNGSVIRPFKEMKEFALQISKGNMESKLNMDRGNYFGDFTWAFENMRKEIVKSRNAEKNAIENNKTVIATLSHDIKTPMASIRAYAEAFEANMDSSPEKRQKYLSILMNKCDEVSKLTNDLFIHSISEMDSLEVKDENLDLIQFIDKDVRSLFALDDMVDIMLPSSDSLKNAKDGSAKIKGDSKRLLQVMENLKSNSEKYAKSRIEISLELDGETKRIHFRDYGPGIPEEELPFITGKFYRGKNCGKENGSGLGLYIVNELVAKMNGKLAIYNKEPGLDVVIEFAQ